MTKSAESLLKQIEAKLAQTLRELPPIIANEAENFTLDNFQEQAWRGFSQERWKKRKNPTKWGKKDETDRALLVKSGQLKRSIRSRTEEDKVIKDIVNLMRNTEYIRDEKDSEGRAFRFHYLRITLNKEFSYIVIREDLQTKEIHFILSLIA